MGSVPYVIKLRVLAYLFMCDYQVSVPTNYFRRRKPPSLVGQSIFSQARLGPRITVQEHKVQLCPITVVPPSLYSRFCDFSVCICICSYGLVHFLYICFHLSNTFPPSFHTSHPGQVQNYGEQREPAQNLCLQGLKFQLYLHAAITY